jgi:hypothetical protein
MQLTQKRFKDSTDVARFSNYAPNAPRRPLSSYMCYCAAQRGAIRERNPEMTFADIARQLGVNWREMSVEEKSGYAEQS